MHQIEEINVKTERRLEGVRAGPWDVTYQGAIVFDSRDEGFFQKAEVCL